MAEWSKQPESRGLPCAVAEPLSSGAAGHQLTAANSLKTHPLSWHPLQKTGDMHWLEGARIQFKAPGNFFGGRLATLSLAQPYEVEAFSAENKSIYCPVRRGQAHPILDTQGRRPADDFFVSRPMPRGHSQACGGRPGAREHPISVAANPVPGVPPRKGVQNPWRHSGSSAGGLVTGAHDYGRDQCLADDASVTRAAGPPEDCNVGPGYCGWPSGLSRIGTNRARRMNPRSPSFRSTLRGDRRSERAPPGTCDTPDS